MAEERMTVAGAYAKIEGHEELCAERYKGIHDAIGRLEGGQRSATRAVWAVVLALIGWLALQVWEGRNNAPVQAVTVNPPPAVHAPAKP